ncbi:hypothetical protein CYY_006413 [Polysphondylium violaceum]|uniref:Methyltransferase domain-containing protein n=1 Tax=Polysphondylium violaceum TaxID=133409 RepID=A0A8J4Q011_9MYCE|nr:hypothetical protein CYY_006413 [Polysphondylium violaceum]
MQDNSNNINLHQLNRLSWNEATKAHNSHKGDQGKLLKEGWCTLFEEDKELLGDVKGLDILHLQCNSGQDSLSIARLGANVLGVDISDEAIEFARKLSKESGIEAQFELGDIIEWMPLHKKQYDIIYCSYGTICWINSKYMDEWAQGIHKLLKPNGRFVFIDFHPFLLYFNNQWEPTYSYFFRGPLEEDGVGDYVEDSGDALKGPQATAQKSEKFENPHKSFEFFHGLGDIFTPLLKTGLLINHFKEYPYSNGWKGFKDMKEIGSRKFEPPEYIPKLPLMFSIVVKKQ